MFNPQNKNLLSIDSFYKKLFNPILSKDEGIDPEIISNIMLSILGKTSIHKDLPIISNLLSQLRLDLEHIDHRLEQNILGCKFKNPIGIAAGFDKNGVAAGIWHCFGFGFAELGTVTLHPQVGNPKPRLFRLAKEKAALNRMGFNNNGAKMMHHTITNQSLNKRGERPAVIGINLGKSKITSLNEAYKDYSASLEILAPIADYIVINVSSPNTPGLRELQDEKELRKLIKSLKLIKSCPPLFVKIAPDLSNTSLEKISIVAEEEKLSGLIAVNTSIDRLGLDERVIAQSGLTLKEELGGLSGSPLKERAIEVIRRLRSKTNTNLVLIGVGGIDSPRSAWERIAAGASLIQLYTGWIFEGPKIVPQIIEGISIQLDKHGFKHISEVVGSEAKWID